MNSPVLTNILLMLISLGLGLIIKVLFNISSKVNVLDVGVNVLKTKQENTEKKVDEHNEILKHVKIKPA